LLDEVAGTEVWVKHENHTPVGAFKIRVGIVYMDELRRAQPGVRFGEGWLSIARMRIPYGT
jgi:threonine dehydratase